MEDDSDIMLIAKWLNDQEYMGDYQETKQRSADELKRDMIIHANWKLAFHYYQKEQRRENWDRECSDGKAENMGDRLCLGAS